MSGSRRRRRPKLKSSEPSRPECICVITVPLTVTVPPPRGRRAADRDCRRGRGRHAGTRATAGTRVIGTPPGRASARDSDGHGHGHGDNDATKAGAARAQPDSEAGRAPPGRGPGTAVPPDLCSTVLARMRGSRGYTVTPGPAAQRPRRRLAPAARTSLSVDSDPPA